MRWNASVFEREMTRSKGLTRSVYIESSILLRSEAIAA